MLTWTVVTSVTLVSVCLWTPTSGIRCYECDSDEHNYDPSDPCLDKFTGSGVPTCEGDVCVKAKGEIDSQNLKGVQRACFPESSTFGIEGCEEDKKKGVYGAVCYCRTELCNGATRMASSSVVIATIMVISTLG